MHISRRGSRNPNVWCAVLGVIPSAAFLMLLVTSAWTTWASAALSLSSGLGAGAVIVLAAHAFCRRGMIDDHGYTESMSWGGWQLWQESFSVDEIESLSLEGQYFSETTQPYAYRIYLRLTSGAELPSFIFAKHEHAEHVRQQITTALARSK